MTNPHIFTEDESPRELTQEERKKLVVGQCNYLLVMLLSFAAFIMSNDAAFNCNFAERSIKYFSGFTSDSICAQADLSSFEEPVCKTFLDTHGVGFFEWMGIIPVNQQVCLSYTQYVPEVGFVTPEFDSAFNAAKAFAVMAVIFGGFGWLSVILASCCPFTQERVKGLTCYFSFACICQSFTFLLHGSSICDPGFFQQYFPTVDVNNFIQEVTCTLADGGKRGVAAAVLYAVCSVLALYAVAPAPVGYGRHQASDGPIREPKATNLEAQTY